MKELDIDRIFDKYYVNDDSLEVIIKYLRDLGFSQMECTKALKVRLKISLREADEIVLNSSTWADNFESTKKFREDVFDFLDNLPDDNSYKNS